MKENEQNINLKSAMFFTVELQGQLGCSSSKARKGKTLSSGSTHGPLLSGDTPPCGSFVSSSPSKPPLLSLGHYVTDGRELIIELLYSAFLILWEFRKQSSFFKWYNRLPHFLAAQSGDWKPNWFKWKWILKRTFMCPEWEEGSYCM